MRNSTFYPLRAMTKEDVLAAIRDSYRFSEQLDPEAEPDYDLTFRSTVEDWRTACDLLPAKALGRALNNRFKVHFTSTEWISVLEPAKTATLERVCELIASQATMPVVESYGALGARCESAGAFLAMRNGLRREGVAVDELRPSTPIREIANDNLKSFVALMSRLAPGVFPIPGLAYRRLHTVGLCCGGYSLLSSILAGITGIPVLGWSGILSLIVSILILRHTTAQAFKNASYGDVRTFKDLAEKIRRSKQHQS